MEETKKMKWQKDLDSFFPIYNSFIFEGFIDDDQPYEDENGEIKYCRLYDYFDKVYSNHTDKNLRKRVIIYDPTESEDKKFKICDTDCRQEDEPSENGEGEPKKVVKYLSSEMSQHFWDICHNEDVEKLLIDHKNSGASLDFSRIHYAVTEGTNRLASFEILEKFQSFFTGLFGGFQNNEEPNGYLFVIKMTSRLLSRDGEDRGLDGEELMYFRQLLNIAQSLDNLGNNQSDGVQNNKLIILANSVRDLPMWFTDEIANPFIKLITVSKPSEDNKIAFLHEVLSDSSCCTAEFVEKFNESDRVSKEKNPNSTRNPIEKKFLAYTNDFSMNMLRHYKEYLKEKPLSDPSKLGYSLSSFRSGDMTNPWDDDAKIRDMLNIKETVSRKIQGQDFALDTAQDILTRAATGVDRAENPNAPRVVLFLAGPTGTGKTELCKQLAESIFGSEDRIVRFDMSEYGERESDQKLFGAPPGYVGYEEGGKLTNAVKKEPFSLILFDEIEKAHNSILDKFLQILGDGRLTDGKGETVRFTDSIIVITSNAGVMKFRRPDGSEMNPDEMSELMNGDVPPEGTMNMDTVIQMETQMMQDPSKVNNGSLTNEALKEIYDVVKEHLRYNVKAYFHCGLKRPELYGRIEDSIVYYNYIGRESVLKIVKSKISDVVKSTKEMNGLQDISVPENVLNAISNYCQDCKVRALGARGIIKTSGKIFSTSLSSFLSPYIRGVEGKTREQLRGKTITCSCSDIINSSKDITWSVVNG